MPIQEEREHDEMKRRIERVETGNHDLAMVMRENTLALARLDETVREFRTSMEKVHAIERNVGQLEFAFSAIRWLATAIGGAAVVLVMSYLFRNQSI